MNEWNLKPKDDEGVITVKEKEIEIKKSYILEQMSQLQRIVPQYQHNNEDDSIWNDIKLLGQIERNMKSQALTQDIISEFKNKIYCELNDKGIEISKEQEILIKLIKDIKLLTYRILMRCKKEREDCDAVVQVFKKSLEIKDCVKDVANNVHVISKRLEQIKIENKDENNV